MKIIRLENSNNKIFDKICEWNYNWWGIRNHESFEEVKCGLEHSLNTDRLPQTFVALIDNEPVGMYQLSMCEDLNSRPDIYPWLINVYVDENYRGQKTKITENDLHSFGKGTILRSKLCCKSN